MRKALISNIILSGPMYQSFRETGFFFGNDAKFCAFEHPDAALRGSLDVRSVVAGDGTILDAAAYTALFKHCVAKIFDGSGEVSEISHFQAVFPFKPAFGDIEKMILGALFFEGNFPLCDSDSALCSKVYVTPESFMTAQSVGAMSAVVIDVGARVTHIVPVYEGVAIKMSMRAVRIGGEHCTDALEKLVDAKGLAAYSSSLPRRRKQIARDLKEKYGFVAESFDKAVELYGAITVEAVRVMHGSSTELPAALNRLLAVDNSDIKKDQSTISIFEEIKHPNGTAEVISLDRERFYCTEVLFGEATEPCEVPGDLDVEDSIMSAILAAAESIEDYDMRVEICEKIVLTGGSAMLPGFLERFQTSELLKEGLRKSGITSFHILIAASDKKLASSSVLNGAQTRLVALQSKTERMEGGCVSASDYEKFGSSCFDNLA